MLSGLCICLSVSPVTCPLRCGSKYRIVDECCVDKVERYFDIVAVVDGALVMSAAHRLPARLVEVCKAVNVVTRCGKCEPGATPWDIENDTVMGISVIPR